MARVSIATGIAAISICELISSGFKAVTVVSPKATTAYPKTQAPSRRSNNERTRALDETNRRQVVRSAAIARDDNTIFPAMPPDAAANVARMTATHKTPVDAANLSGPADDLRPE